MLDLKTKQDAQDSSQDSSQDAGNDRDSRALGYFRSDVRSSLQLSLRTSEQSRSYLGFRVSRKRPAGDKCRIATIKEAIKELNKGTKSPIGDDRKK